MAYYALSFDPADDPVVDPQLSVSYIGNSIRSYIYDVTGAWLYAKYACMEVRACMCGRHDNVYIPEWIEMPGMHVWRLRGVVAEKLVFKTPINYQNLSSI